MAYGRMFAIRNAAPGLGPLRLDTVTDPRAYLKLSLRGSDGTLPRAPASLRQRQPCQPLLAVSAHSAPSPSRNY